MTPDEKNTQRTQRNADICAFYLKGHKLRDCASEFRLGRQRVLQILQRAGVWKPYVKSKRTQFLGVNVTEETKDALTREARGRGTSVSQLVSDRLEKSIGEKR